MEFVVITGMSGAGKSCVMNALEDIGFFCVDNLPAQLIPVFAQLLTKSQEHTRVAVVTDVRAGQSFSELFDVFDTLKELQIPYKLMFLDADDEVLIKRYKETRRIHPVSGGGSLEEGIRRERQILQNVKKRADYVFDTSNLLTRVLKEELDRIFRQNQEYSSLIVRVVSFGFKYGIPMDADLVFDVRFLPNPYYIDELKHQTGNDAPVHDYVMSFPEAGEFLQKLTDMLQFLIPNYIKEGKHQLVIAVGCTGGKHRSVTLANELYESLHKQGNYGITITHRDEKL